MAIFTLETIQPRRPKFKAGNCWHQVSRVISRLSRLSEALFLGAWREASSARQNHQGNGAYFVSRRKGQNWAHRRVGQGREQAILRVFANSSASHSGVIFILLRPRLKAYQKCQDFAAVVKVHCNKLEVCSMWIFRLVTMNHFCTWVYGTGQSLAQPRRYSFGSQMLQAEKTTPRISWLLTMFWTITTTWPPTMRIPCSVGATACLRPWLMHWSGMATSKLRPPSLTWVAVTASVARLYLTEAARIWMDLIFPGD